MKKILLILFGVLFVSGAYSAQIANVEYVHKMIEQTWDITVPYNDALNSVKQIANMKYLLSTIDVANHMLNGSATTDYGNGEFATLQVADTDTVNTAVETLIVGDGTTERNYKFFITTTPGTSSFSFSISAAGEFYVDWGDGTRNKITRTNTQILDYSHNYSTAGTYTIKIGGQATAYNTTTTITAISFQARSYRIASIDGSLGAIFGTLADGSQPRFYGTFSGASNMTGSIPENLFAGIFGAPTELMFSDTFSDCSGLTSIPAGLFAGISGAPATSMFARTFSGCTGLTSIPAGLFAGISGAPASRMFERTFEDCIDLTGAIPDGLFGNLTGAPASYMFQSTFSGCSGLTGAIPDGLFAGISGNPAANMFYSTFRDCSGLTGAIPNGLFAGISGNPAANMFQSTFSGCSGLTGAIPDGLFAGISGNPATNMFDSTFDGCSGLTGAIPAGLFGNLTGAPASQMFNGTFVDCSGLTGAIPDGLFGNLTGAPAYAMFDSTFSSCSKLTSIPENLFGDISGTAKYHMFRQTFYNCTSLTGPSARINGQYLYEIWPNTDAGSDMYSGATGLSDYSSIPTAWK